MNDSELDDMLNKWEAPEPGPALRSSVKNAFVEAGPSRRRLRWPSWHIGKGLFGMAAGAAAFLLVVGVAFPSSVGITPSPALHAPYLVTSKQVTFNSDGSRGDETTRRGYNYKGAEIVIDEQNPNQPIHEFFMNFHIGMRMLFMRVLPGVAIHESPENDRKFAQYVRAGCVDSGDEVLGHDTILGHPVVMVRGSGKDWRFTGWRAPDLGCFTLKARGEDPLPDGNFRLSWEREAVNVTMTNR